MDSNYIESVIKQFTYNKSLGDKTFEQLNDEDIHRKFNEYSNNIAIITKHIVGNMLSRWTNFLTEDGEKDWRKRDLEFQDSYSTKEEMILAWEKAWKCLFDTITPLKAEDLERVIYIRNEGHTVIEAINRQLTHYAYHIGQIVFLGTLIKNNDWQSLSIPKNQSGKYNKGKFNKEKHRGHFTDDL